MTAREFAECRADFDRIFRTGPLAKRPDTSYAIRVEEPPPEDQRPRLRRHSDIPVRILMAKIASGDDLTVEERTRACDLIASGWMAGGAK